MNTQTLKPSELLSKPGAWCQGGYAFNAQGQACDPESPEAVCWCALGAIRACPDLDPRAMRRVWVRMGEHFGNTDADAPESLANWQDEDGRTQAEVVSFLQSFGL